MFNNYIGKAGQLYVMSEFLMLGYNVAIPEVDRGDDIFVVRDSDGNLSRIQVKTAQIKSGKAQFALPRSQINSTPTPEITYVLLVRDHNKWQYQFSIRRIELANILAERLEKISKDKTINLSINTSGNAPRCGSIDFSIYQQLSDLFPAIAH